MEVFFMGCMAVGVLFALVSVLFGDVISQAVDGALDFLASDGHHAFQPIVLFGTLTAFGGAGLLLTRYTALGSAAILAAALLAAVAIGAIVYFAYVRPMRNSENSVAFSIRDLSGKIGEALTTIPPAGYGEVLVRIGAGHTNQIAASFNGETIGAGSRIVVVEVKDDTLFVTRLDN